MNSRRRKAELLNRSRLRRATPSQPVTYLRRSNSLEKPQSKGPFGDRKFAADHLTHPTHAFQENGLFFRFGSHTITFFSVDVPNYFLADSSDSPVSGTLPVRPPAIDGKASSCSR